eukprot:Lankesteria_metandrocarpae@DN4337_c0_g1_i2.p1
MYNLSGIDTGSTVHTPNNNDHLLSSKTVWRLFQASMTLCGGIDTKRTITSILSEAQQLVSHADATSILFLYDPQKHCLIPMGTTPSQNSTGSITGTGSISGTGMECDNVRSDVIDEKEQRLQQHFANTKSTGTFTGSVTGIGGLPCDSMHHSPPTASVAERSTDAHTSSAAAERLNGQSIIQEATGSGSHVPVSSVHKLLQRGSQIPLSDVWPADNSCTDGSSSSGEKSQMDTAVVAFFTRKCVTRCARRTRSAALPQHEPSCVPVARGRDPSRAERYCTLTVPVSDSANSIRALIKVESDKCSSENGTCIFSDEDILAMSHLARLSGVALRNAALCNDAIVSRDLADGVLRLIGSMSPELSVQSAVLALTTNAKKIIRVKQCTVYLIDRLSSQLLLMSSDIAQSPALYRHFNIDDQSSMFGECIKQGKAVAENLIETSCLHTKLGLTPNSLGRAASIEFSIPLPVETENRILATPRLDFGRVAAGNRTYSSALETISKSQLLPHGRYSNAAVAPILSECQQAIGLIELINKRDSDGYLTAFTEEDLLLIETLGRLVGPRLERSDLGHKAVHRRMSEAARADNLKEVEPRSDRRPSAVGLSIPEEEEEAN